MINLTYKKGYTLLEILIVLAILASLSAIIFPKFSAIKDNQVLNNGASDIISALNKARSQTLSSLNSSEYGVYFEPNKVIIFKGTVYSSSASDNETISILSPATISAINLTGGVSSLYFNMLSGTPSATGAITITNSAISKTITISATGAASMN